jgi:hypothetical protein
MEQLSAWLARAIREERAALNSLRTSATAGKDLMEALKSVVGSVSVPAGARSAHVASVGQILNKFSG